MTFATFLSKWLHLASMIAVLGGAILVYFAALPGGAEADSEERGRVRRIYGRLAAILWAVIILTGLFNTYVVSPSVNKGYHMALGGKIALALIMFGLSMLLAHPSERFRAIQQNARSWYAAIIVLGILIVGLSAHLNISRITGTGLDPAKTARPLQGAQ